jgi:hypothetical protein
LSIRFKKRTRALVGDNVQAASASRDDVNNAIGLASPGQTVFVPAGSVTWSSGITTNKNIILRANGTVTITNNYTGGSLIGITESTVGNIRVHGFTFVAGTGPANANPDFFIRVSNSSGGKPVLISSNTFTMSTSHNALGFATNKGVIWGNTFTGALSTFDYKNNASCVRHKWLTSDQSVWMSAHTMGSVDTNGDSQLYFENNTISNVFEGFDCDDFARSVCRFNTVSNCNFGTHGNDTSPWGNRSMEVYGNKFIYDTTPFNGRFGLQPADVNSFTSWRGGTGRVHNNIYAAIQSQAWGSRSPIQLACENGRRAGTWGCWPTYPSFRQTGWGYTSGGSQVGNTGATLYYQDIEPLYHFANTGAGASSVSLIDHADQCSGGQPSSFFIQENREWFRQNASFTGASGTGSGTLVTMNALSPSTSGVGFWVTDEGSWNGNTDGTLYTGQGRLYTWNGSAWVLSYTPYTYPHPLATAL